MGNETIYWDGLTAFTGKAIDTFPKMNLGVSLEGIVTFYAENLCALLLILDIPRKINHTSAVTFVHVV